MPRPTARLLVVLTLACTHPEAFPSGDSGDDGPSPGGPPSRLTFNTGQDLTPAWYPDATGLLYAYEQPERSDHDYCVGVLPPAGGRRQAERCHIADLPGDSVDARAWPAANRAGLLAWVEQQGLVGLRNPASGAIRVGSLDPRKPGAVVRSLPYPAPSGSVHVTATHLAWLQDSLLLYLGADFVTGRACNSCPYDSLTIGREVMTLDLRGDPPAFSPVPGTSGATAVAALPGGDAILYSLAGDSRVFRRTLSSGVVDTLWDFSGLGIARDPLLAGNRLLAVVGGRVTYAIDPLFGPFQADSGGALYAVDLIDSSLTTLTASQHLVRHPALRPDGAAVAVELVDSLGPFVPDLYLIPLP